MRIAVIGSGIAGLASAWLLSRQHEVTLFEANSYFGGHTHTHEVEQAGQRYRVDSGFIVHNPAHYPLLTRLFDELGVGSQPTAMSFSVHSEASGLEYNAATLDTLFCQRRNLLSPRFLGMVRDLRRFYREAPALLSQPGDTTTLGDYLQQHGYGEAFRDEHLIPMASALWSSPARQILAFPVRYLVQFMANHQMLQISDRPPWRVVKGGSSTYVAALRAMWSVTERLNCPVFSIRRREHHVAVDSAAGTEQFDQIVLACHSDQALSLLEDASPRERSILGAMTYQTNDTVLHTDANVLPRQRKAWAAWNAWLPRERDAPCTVSYCMNLLQGIESPEPFVVTLNRSEAIDPNKVLARMRYHHPVYTQASVQAQTRKVEIQGTHRTWFAGAYWGWGFHEDGMRSAVDVAAGLGVGLAVGQRVGDDDARSGAGGVTEQPISTNPPLQGCEEIVLASSAERARLPGAFHQAKADQERPHPPAAPSPAAQGKETARLHGSPSNRRQPLNSAVYEGIVRHRRHTPHAHAFGYRMAQLYLDLDEVEQIFAQRWLWSTAHGNVAEFRRGDYLGPAEVPLAEAVRRRVEQATGQRPVGPIRLLTHLRYVGVVFNPVSFYYCFAEDGHTLVAVVADITNTPWKERHAYVLPIEHAQRHGRALHWTFAKTFHVSPFMPMDCQYDWRFTVPGDDLRVHMNVLRHGERAFDATLNLQRRPLNGAALARVLWRYPLMTAQVVGAIHWQALRLWMKRNPLHDHPLPRADDAE